MPFIHAIIDRVLPEVFNKDGAELVECDLDVKSVGVDQFQSEVVFMSAVVRNGSEKKYVPLIIKSEMGDLKLREVLRSDAQFHNEVTMYTKVLPFMNRYNIVENSFPKFYHGVCSDENRSFIVIEDLRPLGYRLTEERGIIDLAHLSIAMAKLGRFHALSYAAKKEFPEMFFNLVKSLKERSWIEGRFTTRFNHVIKACIHRAVDPLIKQGKHVQVLRMLLARIKDDESVTDFMRDLVTPEEPWAVICHGDFCRNNMLFSYDDKGNPKDVKFFDIATARYSSPAVDITFFLLLNGSRFDRRNHWDELLSVYYQSLSTAVPGLEVPSLEDIREEVRQKALYGFVHCSYFIPKMMFGLIPITNDALLTFGKKDFVALYTTEGGEEGTNLLSALVEDLVKLQCLAIQNKYLVKSVLSGLPFT